MKEGDACDNVSEEQLLENLTLKPKDTGIIDRKCLKSNMPLKLKEGGGKDRISLENNHQHVLAILVGTAFSAKMEYMRMQFSNTVVVGMTVRCEFFLSLNFSDEKPSDGNFIGRCIKGKVCPNYIHFPDYPAYLKRLMTN